MWYIYIYIYTHVWTTPLYRFVFAVCWVLKEGCFVYVRPLNLILLNISSLDQCHRSRIFQPGQNMKKRTAWLFSFMNWLIGLRPDKKSIYDTIQHTELRSKSLRSGVDVIHRMSINNMNWFVIWHLRYMYLLYSVLSGLVFSSFWIE